VVRGENLGDPLAVQNSSAPLPQEG
jgi:hypothetical protein